MIILLMRTVRMVSESKTLYQVHSPEDTGGVGGKVTAILSRQEVFYYYKADCIIRVISAVR